MTESVFVCAIFLVAFAYFGYPITLWLISRIHEREVHRESALPQVSFIVTVHNEEARIQSKLDNILSLDYPRNKLQILVSSDGSTDRTNEIVRGYADQGIELLDWHERGGKESAQKSAIPRAMGTVIVFSDAATTMENQGLRFLVAAFADASVGCVSSEDRLVGKDGQTSGEGLYVRYEMWLRGLESSTGSLVGLSGSLFAARREVCENFASDMQSDFRTVFNCVRLGLRAVSERRAVGIYQDTADPKREWERKIRTVVRGLTVLFRHRELLNPLSYGLFSYQLFCHKLLRWLVPLFLVLALTSNVLLAGTSVGYAVLLALQLSFYALGGLGLLMANTQRSVLVRVPTYFLAVNASIAIAWWRYMKGDRIVTWTPTKR
jgi:cellulose synthase/poly-beta-1,6-N-acetylglucosamine synthase-like glycosyltransferase